MQRIRVETKIEADAASPDSIAAMHQYLIGAMVERAEDRSFALDWTTYTTYVRVRKGMLVMVAWAKVMS